MLISIPISTSIVETNVVDETPIYDVGATYEDGDLVQYDPNGGSDYSIYGVFNVNSEHNLVYYSATAPNAPIDEKNYSVATAANVMTYTLIGTSTFDTLGVGHVIGDTISVYFKDPAGNTIYSIINREIDNKIDEDGRHPIQPVTEVLYAPQDMQHGSTVEIIIVRDTEIVEVGSLYLGLSVNAGFTNLIFDNSFIDLSPTEQDQWGNVFYKDGAKMAIHNGTVDLPISDYDYMNRTMLAIGGNTVILNGYGLKHNDKPDNKDGHFYATMMIGRMKNFSLKTTLIDKRLGEMAQYKIRLEEIV